MTKQTTSGSRFSTLSVTGPQTIWNPTWLKLWKSSTVIPIPGSAGWRTKPLRPTGRQANGTSFENFGNFRREMQINFYTVEKAERIIHCRAELHCTGIFLTVEESLSARSVLLVLSWPFCVEMVIRSRFHRTPHIFSLISNSFVTSHVSLS